MSSRKRIRVDDDAPAMPKTTSSFSTSSRLTMAVPKDTPLFADLRQKKALDQTIIDTIVQDLKFSHMMPVQAATIDDVLVQRNDCLVQARTGTGKTLAFLLPSIQSALDTGRTGGGSIATLILSPTRELALQIAAEAKALTARMSRFKIATAIGGTNKNTEARHLACTILVATPGRLIDHMSDPGVPELFGRLQTLVLDEADRMLDMGFMPSINQILQYLPKKDRSPRHSMLFSATLDDNVKNVARKFLDQDYKFISTIPKGEAQTHDRVPQFSMVVPSPIDVAPAMVATVLKERQSAQQFKAIVFATTAQVADFYAHLLSHTKGLPPVSALHSRLSQSRRTNITNQFRTAENAICVATDVIARGMDFPGVTHVFQAGLPMDRESYVHRLGRTARAEADGRGILILSQPESFFLNLLKGINVQPYPAVPYSLDLIAESLQTLENKQKIYQAWLGYYKTSVKQLRWSVAELVQQANQFAIAGLGCPEVPEIEKTTVGKMGLKGVPGLNIVANRPRNNQQSRGGAVARGGDEVKPRTPTTNGGSGRRPDGRRGGRA
jgi:ATP-dependent RNA helicase MSS116, mitochondrial